MVVALLGMGSCGDEFLDIQPNDRVSRDNFFQSPEDLQAATALLYSRVWFDFNDKFFFAMGDGRANNLFAPYSDYVYPFTTLTETSLTGPLVSAWLSLYIVVAQSNSTMSNIQKYATGVTDAQKNTAIGEARFMRGVAYWYLASLWEDVVLVDENNTSIMSNFIVPANPRLDVFEFAIRDLEFAAKWLPEASPAAGRLNKYSAYAMLSRVYLSRAGLSGDDRNSGQRDEAYLTLAKKAAEKVCKEGPFKLMESYADLFKVANNNNSESVFALQWVPGFNAATGYGNINTHQAYFAPNSTITGDDAAWGGYVFASYDVMTEYELDDIRRDATFMSRGMTYPELNAAAGGYLQDNTDQCYVRKGLVGTPADNEGKSGRMNSALNTYMMRLAEVYLIYAEAVLGNNASTSDADALLYFNRVRSRAGMPVKGVISYEDIRRERRIELAMEGQYWYDLVRRSYYRQQEVIGYMNSQSRAAQYIYDKDAHTATDRGEPDSRPVATADASKLKLPYPESEVVSNPKLKEAPVPYVFTEEKITDLFE